MALIPQTPVLLLYLSSSRVFLITSSVHIHILLGMVGNYQGGVFGVCITFVNFGGMCGKIQWQSLLEFPQTLYLRESKLLSTTKGK